MAERKSMSLREKRRIETREHLIAATVAVMSERGFQAASIDQITAEAGTSRATFYAYFETKESALAAVLEQMWSEVEELYRQFGELEEWSAQAIGSWLSDFAHAWQATAARNRAASEASRAELLEDLPSRYRQIVRSVRSQPQLWSHFTANEADARASMMVHLVQQVFTTHFMDDGAADSTLLVEQLTAAVRDLLRAEK